MATDGFFLPLFEMPLPYCGASSAETDIERDLWDWADGHGLITTDAMRRHLARTRPSRTTALYYPQAHARELLPVNRYMTLAFVVDDLLDDAADGQDMAAVTRLCDELTGVALGTRDPASGPGRALHDALGDLSAGRSQEWQTLIREVSVRWLRTYPVEAEADRDGRVMEFAEYVAHRRWSVDEIFYLHMAEFVNGLDLPAEVRRLPALVQARHRASEWVGLFNDICSFAKEEGVGYRHNAVEITRARLGCSVQTAVDRVNAVLTGLMYQFQAACAAAPAQVKTVAGDQGEVEAALLVLDGYRYIVRGNFDYHRHSDRYNAVADYLPGAQHGTHRPDWAGPSPP
ncbi:hypothetical protein [Streptomyces sp. NPDC051567]|uniref:terpene synthase family protein n=1 Tax=Streptomyces sp. NPDC051567 TaxID=3365660 RepID=UPI00378B451B